MCSVHTRGGTREHAWVHKIFTLCALRSVWYLMLMLSKHYVDPAKSPADKAAGAQWADHRGRILSIQGFAGSPSHWSVFFYLLSVCFLSTSGQSSSKLLSIQGFAGSPSHWSVFFYLLSVCFLSTSGQSLSEFLSIQGFARSPSQ